MFLLDITPWKVDSGVEMKPGMWKVPDAPTPAQLALPPLPVLTACLRASIWRAAGPVVTWVRFPIVKSYLIVVFL